jgi:acyl dehydratase
MQTFATLADFSAQAGQPLGETDYMTVTQEMVDHFGQATGDPVLPGTYSFLTLALAPKLLAQLIKVESIKSMITYGANKIRFNEAIPVGSQLRLKAWLHHAEPQNDNEDTNGIRIVVECAFEVEGDQKPACVAELIMLLFE